MGKSEIKQKLVEEIQKYRDREPDVNTYNRGVRSGLSIAIDIIGAVNFDSHSPDPVVYTLQEGDFMVGTSEQYRKVLKMVDVKHDIEVYVSQCVIQKQMIFLNGKITWCEFPELLRKTKLTPEEFIRRAENTFKK